MSATTKQIVKRSKSNILYVGNSRRDLINKHAVTITKESGIPVQPGDFLQFLIDNFSGNAEAEMLSQLGKMNKEK